MAQQVLRATVLGAQFSEFDGNFYGKVFICQPVASEDSENAKGLSVMSIDISKECYNRLSLPPNPVEAQLDIRMKRAGKNKMSTECIGVRLEKPASPGTSAAAGQATK